MSGSLITLTTDFGAESPYAAAMKGVILGINPDVRLLDLTHQIPPQDLRYTAFFLSAAIPHFPSGVIHVVVVDPGVGTERALLYVEVGGHRLLLPDNGCWSGLADLADGSPIVIRLSEPRFWRQPVSSTFHGRDILAPVAAHLSLGLEPEALGQRTENWIRLDTCPPYWQANSLTGEVVFVDHFGNLLTNIPGQALRVLPKPLRFEVGGQELSREVRCYGEAEPGTPVALISSAGLLEIAVVQGNAARLLAAGVGAPVRITPSRALPG